MAVVHLTWHGEHLTRRVRRAAGRGALDIATDAALAAKAFAAEGDPFPPEEDTHPGTLKRSIHVALPTTPHVDDFERAKGGEDLLTGVDHIRGLQVATNNEVGTDIKIEIGSWIPYACVEEVRHSYIYPAIMLVRSYSLEIMVRDFKEEFG